MSKIKVFVVDDSAVVRQVMNEVLASDSSIEVIGSAPDPIFAMQKMRENWPDVITLDIEMPRMDGITFLKMIMEERPTPVVICSTLTEKGAETTLQALAAGAVSIVTKPKSSLRDFLKDSAAELIGEVKAAAASHPKTILKKIVRQPTLTPDTTGQNKPSVPYSLSQTTQRVVAIGASTGGTQAIEEILRALPRVSPGVVIVQHMPERITTAFAKRLNSLCEIEVREAENGDRVVAGTALIAPGGKHMMLKRSGAQYHVDVQDGPLVNRHKPSVDVLFRSVAKYAGSNALGIILTGMGDDGTAGLLEMLEAGAHTVGQDEESSIVYGMPKEAFKRGAVQRQLPLSQMAAEIQRQNWL
jgi:two-component system, chemotaxis family, protein-glutamate methylesterase/glutaminase